MLSLSYTYDNLGNIKQIINGRRSSLMTWLENVEVYEYDWLNRLISAQGGFGVLQYSYDSSGNRISETENGTMTTYQYDICNRLISYQTNSGNAVFTYDNNGNLKTKAVNGETTQYVYDKENRLRQVVEGEIIGSYTYDNVGKRVHQFEGTKTVTAIYSGQDPIYEHACEFSIHTICDYVYAAGSRIARLSGNQVLYYHVDHLGSTRLVTDVSGAIVTAMSYDPFGKKYEAYGVAEKFGFNGKEEDSQIGLYYYGARYYDPEIGRFVQADGYKGTLANPQTLNRYAYCRNNPLRYVDPTGNCQVPTNPSEYTWQHQTDEDQKVYNALNNDYKASEQAVKQREEIAKAEETVKDVKLRLEAGDYFILGVNGLGWACDNKYWSFSRAGQVFGTAGDCFSIASGGITGATNALEGAKNGDSLAKVVTVTFCETALAGTLGAIGTMVGGPFGGYIGGVVGGKIGHWIGEGLYEGYCQAQANYEAEGGFESSGFYR